MPTTNAAKMIAVALVVAVLTTLGLHGCREQPTEPVEAKAVRAKPRLTIQGVGSRAPGQLTSNVGSLTCLVAYTSGQVSTTGTCQGDFAQGTVVVLTATPPADGGTVSWKGCDRAFTDEPLSCWVTMDRPRNITAAFAPAPSSYTLTVRGGGGGSGSVHSTPAGISCTIAAGSSGSGCSAQFPTSTEVTLTAAASGRKPIKAWAGAGCEQKGGGVGRGRGSCAISMSQAQTIVVTFDAVANEATAGQWSAPFAWPHVAIHTFLLPNGLVMSWGRKRQGMLPVLWNPSAPGAFTPLTMPADYFCSGHSLLPDGRILIAGGHSGTCNFGIRKTYLFNSATNSWKASQKMANGRWYPSVTTLGSGAVVAISGGDTAGVLNRIPEVWKKGTWRKLTTADREVPYFPMIFAAPNGMVFMAGPEQQSMYLSPSGTGAWTTGPMSNFGDRSYGSAVMYDVGKILMVGGNEAAPTSTAEVIDLNAGTPWRYVQSLSVARRQLNATLLADGKVLVTGGTDAPGFNSPPTDSKVLAPELWDPDPTKETWTQLAPMAHYRLYHSTALLLPDATVLSVGSGSPAAQGFTDDLTGEIFSPPYLFNGDGTLATRPTIASAPASVGYGAVFSVSTPDAATITKVTWIRLSAVTHSTNMNQRMNYLTFSAPTSSTLSVTAPSKPDFAPPGHYLLFLVNGNGVPSVGKIVQIQ